MAKGVKATINGFDEVHGAYDLILHAYGPDKLMGSVHIEVDDTMTADQLDALEREITQAVNAEHGVILTGINVYSRNTKNDEAARIQEDVRRTVMAHDHVLQMHGFYLDAAAKEMRFDIIIDFAAPDRVAEYREIVSQVEAKYPDHRVSVSLDVDASD